MSRMFRSERQRGVGLVELMIALVLSLLIVLAVSTLYMRTSAASRTQQQLAETGERARFALDMIASVSRMAQPANGQAAIEVNATGSELTVRYPLPQDWPTDWPTGNAARLQLPACAQLATTLKPGQVIKHRFYLKNNQLMCELSAGTAAAQKDIVLATHIDRLAILPALAAKRSAADNWQQYCAIGTLKPGAFTSSGASPVAGLLVGLLAASERADNAAEQPPATYYLLGRGVAKAGEVKAVDLPDDGRYRQVLSTFVQVRAGCAQAEASP